MGFLRKLDYLFIFFILYLIKSAIYYTSLGYLDIFVLGIISIFWISRHLINKYFKIKMEVISENQFRNKINEDISKILHEITILKSTGGNPFKHLSGKR